MTDESKVFYVVQLNTCNTPSCDMYHDDEVKAQEMYKALVDQWMEEGNKHIMFAFEGDAVCIDTDSVMSIRLRKTEAVVMGYNEACSVPHKAIKPIGIR